MNKEETTLKTDRECRLETVLKTLINRIKEENEDVGIMGSLVKIAEVELNR